MGSIRREDSEAALVSQLAPRHTTHRADATETHSYMQQYMHCRHYMYRHKRRGVPLQTATPAGSTLRPPRRDEA